jgi:uncharacterized repeat protein (TIGR03803 family)
VNGALYGETGAGGDTGAKCPDGCGTIYSITTRGAYKLVYSFRGGRDGIDPNGGLILVNGQLYGVTEYGGSMGCGTESCGTVFELSTAGKEKVLYRFAGGRSDGMTPTAALPSLGGTLYGTTFYGGANGAGTIFAIKL